MYSACRLTEAVHRAGSGRIRGGESGARSVDSSEAGGSILVDSRSPSHTANSIFPSINPHPPQTKLLIHPSPSEHTNHGYSCVTPTTGPIQILTRGWQLITGLQFENSSDIGVFSKLTNSYCLCSIQGSTNFYSAFESELGEVIPIVHTSIGGTRIIGRLTAGEHFFTSRSKGGGD